MNAGEIITAVMKIVERLTDKGKLQGDVDAAYSRLRSLEERVTQLEQRGAP